MQCHGVPGGRNGRDHIEEYKIPDNLRKAMASQFGVDFASVIKTHGEYLKMVKERAVEFYINSGFLIVSKMERRMTC